MGEKNSKQQKIDEFNSRVEQLRSELKENKEAYLEQRRRQETPMLMSMSSPSYQFGTGESKYKTSFANNEEMIKKFNREQ